MIRDRTVARNLAVQFDETFHPDQLTGLNFLVKPDGETAVIALFADGTDPLQLRRATGLLGPAGERVELGLRDLLRSARSRGFVEFYLGDEAVRFMSAGTD